MTARRRVVAAIVALAACGGSDATSTSPETTTLPTPYRTAPPPTPPPPPSAAPSSAIASAPTSPGVPPSTGPEGCRITPTGDLADVLPLTVGSSGDAVATVQGLLVDLGFDVGPDGADGNFGQDTAAAVLAWQASSAETVTGRICPEDLEALLIDRAALEPD